MLSLRTLLEEMSEKNASDLHITAGLPPRFSTTSRRKTSRTRKSSISASAFRV
jgi:Tfp pilus assembly ATPase PilU